MGCKLLTVFLAFTALSAAQKIVVCNSAYEGDDCQKNVPISDGTYTTFNPQSTVYFKIVPWEGQKERDQFGRHTNYHPYSCYFIAEGEQMSERNQFLYEGCPTKSGVSIYRSLLPTMIAFSVEDSWSKPQRNSKYQIVCTFTQCSKKSTGHLEMDCPDPYHCDKRVAWKPNPKYIYQVRSQAQFSFQYQRLLYRYG